MHSALSRPPSQIIERVWGAHCTPCTRQESELGMILILEKENAAEYNERNMQGTRGWSRTSWEWDALDVRRI